MIVLLNKPLGISSAAFASKMGRQMGLKLGFSGTLDPFARGALLCACKKHTKLFRFLNTEPKIYEATIWLGASSASGDDENLTLYKERAISKDEFCAALRHLRGQISYTPPAFCAKKINGVRAYKLARSGQTPELKTTTMQVESEFVALCGPFASFRLIASKGTYVRSYAQLLCEHLKVRGSLCSLARIAEGDFAEFKSYDPWQSLRLSEVFYKGDLSDIVLGKKLNYKDFAMPRAFVQGYGKVDLGEHFAILNFLSAEPSSEVKYELNLIDKH